MESGAVALGLAIVMATVIIGFVVVRYRRMYDSMFSVGREVGSVCVHNSTSILTTVNVRALGNEGTPEWVALEVVFPSRSRWNVQLKLSREEAAELSNLLARSIAASA